MNELEIVLTVSIAVIVIGVVLVGIGLLNQRKGRPADAWTDGTDSRKRSNDRGA